MEGIEGVEGVEGVEGKGGVEGKEGVERLLLDLEDVLPTVDGLSENLEYLMLDDTPEPDGGEIVMFGMDDEDGFSGVVSLVRIDPDKRNSGATDF